MVPPSALSRPGLAAESKGPTSPISSIQKAEILQEDDSTIKTVDELVRRRARAEPDKIIVSYPSSGIQYIDYTLRQLDVFAFRVASHYRTFLPMRTSSAEKPKTVAIMGPSNFEYLITILALTKLGHTILFLSPRISQEAIENLLTVTDTEMLLTDTRNVETIQAVKQSMPHVIAMEMVNSSMFDFPIEIHADTQLDQHLDPETENSNRSFIIHSSGSTGLPKPIYMTQKSALANFAYSMNMKAFTTLPLYHGHGICNLFRAIHSGKSIYLYNADLPLTHDYLVKTLQAYRFEVFYGVPYALKLLAESDEGTALLQELEITMYGGSACSDDLGNMLVDKGVNLVGHYGSTEVGQLMNSFRPAGDKAWNYVRENPRLKPFLRWLPCGPNLFECCVLEGWPSKVASNMEDGSYATKDMFEPHPTIAGAWKYIARRDDTINMMNGELFNPVATEGSIRSSKYVAETVIFGAGRAALGTLIVPSPALASKSEQEVLDLVWPVVESACRNVEAYAQISKDMIKILPADCTYPRTDKGSIIRQAFYRMFEKEINDVYDRVETGTGELQKLDQGELKDFLRSLLVGFMRGKKVEMDDDTDFFLLGLDSLQAIRFRTEILKSIDIGGRKLGQMVVFDHPSIEKLSAYLVSLRSGDAAGQSAAVEPEMQNLINKHSKPLTNAPDVRASVVVTGVTGSLGAHIVGKLSADPTIQTIYCLVRAKSDTEATRRIKSSLLQRKLYHRFPLLHRNKLVALASDLSHPKLGLTDETFRRIKQDLRLVIHSAWSVNFNIKLSSFENGNISGVSHLISLCRAAGGSASFNFCSSVSTVSRATVSPVPESVPELEWAHEMGYAQSKSVAEHLCVRAAAEQDVPTRVLRIGQIVADSQHGVWNATEAIPLQIQTALTIGALPRLQESPCWLSVDSVAQTVTDISLSDAKGCVFTNVVNPKTFSWTDDLLPALKSAGLEFETVEPKEWVRRLRASDPDPEINPPIKLVEFFAGKYDKDEFAPSKRYATKTACGLSPSLGATSGLDRALVQKFVTYFQNGPWAQAAMAANKSQGETGKSGSNDKTIVVVGGPSSVKPTLASFLSSKLEFASLEGDALHVKASVTKMAASLALTDDDRHDWLSRVGSRAVETVTDLGYDGVVVTCSALQRKCRDVLRGVAGKHDNVRLVFIALQAEETPTEVAGSEEPGVDEFDVVPLSADDDASDVCEWAKWALGEIGVLS